MTVCGSSRVLREFPWDLNQAVGLIPVTRHAARGNGGMAISVYIVEYEPWAVGEPAAFQKVETTTFRRKVIETSSRVRSGGQGGIDINPGHRS